MKTIIRTGFLTLSLALLAGFGAHAQEKGERSSPAKQTSAAMSGTELTITYSSPAKKKRVVFGELVPYDKVWRMGANEATTITLGGDMKVAGTLVKAGKYGMFAIPGENSWQIIFNEVWDQWGAYNYDAAKDVVRFTVPVLKTAEPVENFTIEASEVGNVTIMWDGVMVQFEIM